MVPCCNCICCVLLAVTNVNSMPKVFRFFLCWIKSEVYVINIDTPDELLARILDADGRIKKQTNNTRSSHTSCTVH